MRLSRFYAILAITAAHGVIADGGDGDQNVLTNSVESDYVCQHPPYTAQIISTSPLIIYLYNFTTPEERAHLRLKTEGTFRRSAITSKGKTSASRSAVRTSSSSYIPNPEADPILSCIESRALSFQGHHDVPRSHLEPIQLVRYLPGEHYSFHTDWFGNPSYASPSAGGNRLSSFFAYLYVSEDMVGGGTSFPMVEAKRRDDKRWCAVLDCDCEEEKGGVTFRAVEGNAVFWENLVVSSDDGGRRRGDERVIHAGLPVLKGEKIGMNIWTREGAMKEEVRAGIYPVV